MPSWEAVEWVKNLEYGGYDDWRLPVYTADSGPNNEMWYLYNVYGISSQNPNPFYNVGSYYWTGVIGWLMRTFNFSNGQQWYTSNKAPWRAWPVRDGDSIPIPEEISVYVDIKPGSCPNPLNTKSKGVLPVAVLGAEDFDVNEIDVATIRLEGVSPIRSAYEDVATQYEDLIEDANDCSEEGADGFLDLTLKFDTQTVVEALGGVEDGDELILSLIGNLKEEFGGTLIHGEDVVVILKKGK